MKKQIFIGLGIAAFGLMLAAILIAMVNDGSASAARSVASQVYLPLIIRPRVPSYVYLPYTSRALAPTPTPVPNPVGNSGFELPNDANGPWLAGLTYYGKPTEGIDVRASRSQLNQAGISPHTGDYAAWMGGFPRGDNGYLMNLQQEITIPANGSTLRYWYWIQSDEPNCDYASVDGAWLFFITTDQNEIEHYDLCSSKATSGWVKRDISLAAYAGQKGWLTFTTRILGENSNWFIDDVQLGTLAGSQFTPVLRIK